VSALDRNNKYIAKRFRELQVMDVPRMNDVKAPMAVHDHASGRARFFAVGQQLLQRQDLLVSRHAEIIGKGNAKA